MKTIALRFSDNYAPSEGTIKLHDELINKYGYVWYGKFGNSLSQNNIQMLLDMNEKKFLLIKSGGQERYWVYFDNIKKEIEDIDKISSYYRDNRKRVKCWFKVTKFVRAEKNIMSKCCVISNNSLLSNTSKYSMSPYFVIDFKED